MRARGGDGLRPGLVADGAGEGAHAGRGLSRRGGHSAAVPLVAGRVGQVAPFGRAAAAAGVEVIAAVRARRGDGLGEPVVVRAGGGDGLRPGLVAAAAGVGAHAGRGLGRGGGHNAVAPDVRAGGRELSGRDDLAAVGADGVDAAGLAAGGGHGALRRAVVGVRARALVADGVALPLAVRVERPVHGGVVVDGDGGGLKAVRFRVARLDRRGRAVAAHVLKRGAVGEGVVADARHRAGQVDVGQRGAAAEAVLGDGAHARGNGDVRQRSAAGEGGRADLGHRLGDGRCGERLAAFKCEIADGGHRAGVVHVQQLRAVGKALAGHGRDGGGQSGVREAGAGVERAAAEALQPVGQRDGGQPIARETEVTDPGHALGDGQTRELGAHGDAVAADARHAVRQRDLRGGRQEEQRIVAHVRDAFADDDGLEVAVGVDFDAADSRFDHAERLIVPPRREVAVGEVEVRHGAGASDGQCAGSDLPMQAVVHTEVALCGGSGEAFKNGFRIEIRDLKLFLDLVDLITDDLLDDLVFLVFDAADNVGDACRCVHGQAGEQPHDQNETQRQREHALFHPLSSFVVMHVYNRNTYLSKIYHMPGKVCNGDRRKNVLSVTFCCICVNKMRIFSRPCAHDPLQKLGTSCILAV